LFHKTALLPALSTPERVGGSPRGSFLLWIQGLPRLFHPVRTQSPVHQVTLGLPHVLGNNAAIVLRLDPECRKVLFLNLWLLMRCINEHRSNTHGSSSAHVAKPSARLHAGSRNGPDACCPRAVHTTLAGHAEWIGSVGGIRSRPPPHGASRGGSKYLTKGASRWGCTRARRMVRSVSHGHLGAGRVHSTGVAGADRCCVWVGWPMQTPRSGGPTCRVRPGGHAAATPRLPRPAAAACG